ncbi:hypothetical protein FHL15_003305 [Xylaria flabelliformis]|uniref:Uncharacterized protein n=1 Tax=Xylaria flabelliformis TaxID=2512241 RepID=A0A553I6C1_9PEZI|nr:hypothetical protein FHL15_003305 [Xylaria flabelliformis]
MIVAILSVWKMRYQYMASIVATREWALALLAVFTTACFQSLPLIWDYGRKVVSPIWIGPGRPLLFPCRITNTTLFPKKRSFEYSTLLVGVPVGWKGIAGGLISVDCRVPGLKPWHKVDAVDYLIPGPTYLGLRDKLDGFLTSQGIEVSRYPYAYLTTTTGSRGCGRNHLSFWYLYSADKQLKAIVVEMNNVSDKRQPHILFRHDRNIEDVDRDSGVMSSGFASSGKDSQKDIHGSSFISRDGVCSLVASDPLAPNMKGIGPINNSVSFISPKGYAKFLSRIILTGETIDPIQLSLKQRLSFMFRWRWSRIAAFPWIAKEAAKVLFERGLAIWEHPKLLKEIISHHTIEAERGLELVFRNYLRYLVKHSSLSLRVRYVPASVLNTVDEEMLSTAAEGKPDSARHLELRILTPKFYLRFVYYAHDFEAMFCEFSENRTIWLSEPALLPKLVLKKPSPLLSTASYLDYAYFTAIRKLRKVPRKIERPLASGQIGTAQALKDIRGFRLSSMDGYVLAHEEDKTRYLYRHLVLKLFIADRIAWGRIDVLSLVALCLRMLLAWIIVFQ